MTIEQNKGERWHLKKEVQISHLVTTVMVALGAVTYVNKIEQRLAVVETQMVSQRDTAVLLRGQLEKINDKLDRLIERGGK